ncbi:hypothetical protein BDY21DRAFT_365116 [Lineolata rhizophorae]|uniref:Uncharacterized protein n=1 Tax=Lineolata rhizophorae TaxID=578093 RepID=A0A6A6NWR0_9PEZI|nr:hypothetical protein BDY21DRAFT_365116 [Lineolata rhizophorae]
MEATLHRQGLLLRAAPRAFGGRRARLGAAAGLGAGGRRPGRSYVAGGRMGGPAVACEMGHRPAKAGAIAAATAPRLADGRAAAAIHSGPAPPPRCARNARPSRAASKRAWQQRRAGACRGEAEAGKKRLTVNRPVRRQQRRRRRRWWWWRRPQPRARARSANGTFDRPNPRRPTYVGPPKRRRYAKQQLRAAGGFAERRAALGASEEWSAARCFAAPAARCCAHAAAPLAAQARGGALGRPRLACRLGYRRPQAAGGLAGASPGWPISPREAPAHESPGPLAEPACAVR